MKKLIILLLTIVALSAWAQGPLSDTVTYDTIWGRNPNYHYSSWYDTCRAYLTPHLIYPNRRYYCLEIYSFDSRTYLMHADNTMGDTLRVKGLSCMVWYGDDCDNELGSHISPYRLPEYMYLGVFNESKDSLMVIDSLRWDTVKPKVQILPKNIDTSNGVMTCLVYEAYFDSAITLYGKFHIAGSFFSNCNESVIFHNYPTFYVGVNYKVELENRCVHWSNPLDSAWTYLSWENRWSPSGNHSMTNPFHLIVQPKRLVDAVSNDTLLGTVLGGGQHYDSTYVTLTAVPQTGYSFSHWNDGDTSNPRVVFITSDTAFTAYFEPKSVYKLTLSSNAPLLGIAVGDGFFYDGDTATIQALCSTGGIFDSWNDGVTDNPRKVLVSSDTAFVARFRSTHGIADMTSDPFVLTPNPAKESVSVACQFGAQQGEVLLRNTLGQDIRRVSLERGRALLSLSDIPAGIYLVTLITDQGSFVRRLVVQ